MVDVSRVRSVWTGVAGTPWYSNHYFTAFTTLAEANAGVAAVRAIWENNKVLMDDALQVTVEGLVANINVATDQVTSTWSGTDLTTFCTGTGDAMPYANQALIRWQTGVYLAGRQVVGHTFWPGLLEASNGPNGIVQSSTVSSILGQAGNLIAATPQLVVYSRKNATYAVVNGATVPSKWAVLRSRRD